MTYQYFNTTMLKGDITDPGAWMDAAGNIPPAQLNAVPPNLNYPQNGDGRYWWGGNAGNAGPGTMTFVGDLNYLVGTAVVTYQITSPGEDFSVIVIGYSTDGGQTWTRIAVGPGEQNGGLSSGQLTIDLNGASGLQIGVSFNAGGSQSPDPLAYIALAITRNAHEGVPWDSPNALDPAFYNPSFLDINGYPAATLAQLRQRILIRLGFSNQAANPPPGMAALVNDFLTSAQTYLYRRYMALHTKRFFRWKVNPGQRFYSLLDNDENVLSNFHMDPIKRIEWAGIQDSRNVWYPLIEGIPPQLYTMLAKPWRPARYAIRGAIELYPMPDQTYWLWMRAHFGLLSFVNDTDQTTLDSELVFLHALANAKSHYGQPDANNIEAQANAYRQELIAGTHATAHYLPGTIAVPPAVRPTLIQYQDNQSG